MFHSIKDNMNLNKKLIDVQLKCFSCSEPGHLARDCPKIHFVVDPEAVIK